MFNNSQQNSPKKLSPSHQLAVDLRVSGYSYQEIASRVNSKDQTVRSWFMRGGFCQEAYEYKNRLLAEDRWVKIRQIEAGILDVASEALKVMRNAVAKGDSKVSIKVLEMAGFKGVQKIEEVQPQEDEGILLLREMITAYRIKAKEERENEIDQKEAVGLNRLSDNTSGNHTPIT